VVITQDSNLVQTGHNFSGAGPTGEAEVRYHLGDSGFALYGTGRSSVLFGRGRNHSLLITREVRTVTPTRGPVQNVNTIQSVDQTRGYDDVIPVDEVEFGVEWSRTWCHLYWFVQAGVTAQGWYHAGIASSEIGDLSFFGLSLSAGVSY
jgi:hypothetical protein